ncbi:MAG: hypothetical protein R3C59_29510 [Planctomycetaceae bacterium]
MPRVLIAAAIYNLAWGGFAIAWPLALFRWTGFEPLPIYPEFWQCIGMIVGVYGVGYAIAATDPFRHWPIVLVGLLGKIFGPLGFAAAALDGRLPAALGWTILTNDVIWWIPFVVILWSAAKASQCRMAHWAVAPPTAPIDPVGRLLSQFGASLSELSRESPVLTVFLRHSGCTFCREALADLGQQRHHVEALGTTIALIHPGHSHPTELLERYGLADVHCFRDPAGVLYDAFRLSRGSFRQLLGPAVWWRGFLAWQKHGIGPLNGDGFRMPGVFLLHHGAIVRAFRHLSAADRPDYVDLAKLPERAASSDAQSTHA